VSRTAIQITEVTEQNASGASESLSAAHDLENQVTKLSKMVKRFAF
jgi:methyl-accepting chemotaxis protein